jgi:hypothetical protein
LAKQRLFRDLKLLYRYHNVNIAEKPAASRGKSRHYIGRSLEQNNRNSRFFQDLVHTADFPAHSSVVGTRDYKFGGEVRSDLSMNPAK